MKIVFTKDTSAVWQIDEKYRPFILVAGSFFSDDEKHTFHFDEDCLFEGSFLMADRVSASTAVNIESDSCVLIAHQHYVFQSPSESLEWWSVDDCIIRGVFTEPVVQFPASRKFTSSNAAARAWANVVNKFNQQKPQNVVGNIGGVDIPDALDKIHEVYFADYTARLEKLEKIYSDDVSSLSNDDFGLAFQHVFNKESESNGT